MPLLSSHTNVFETCLQILEARGWLVILEYGEDNDPDCWLASRNGLDLNASNPIELLGLVAIVDERYDGVGEPYWWSRANSKPRVSDRIEDEATKRDEARVAAFEALRRGDPVEWERRVREAVLEYGDVANSAHVLEIPRDVLRRVLAEPGFADLGQVE